MNSKRLQWRWQLTGHDRRKLRRALAGAVDRRHTRRIQAVLLVAQGHGIRHVATMTGLSHQSVYNALRRYRRHRRPADLADRSRSGRPRAAAALHRRQLLAVLQEDPWTLGYNATTWTVDLLARRIQTRYRQPITHPTLRRRLRALRWRWKRPRHSYKRPDPHQAQKKGALSGV